MARPQKQTVDYFPHSCNHKKTMFILEERYGNDGYAFWFKLLEMIGNAKGHCIELSDPSEMEFLLAKTHASEVTGLEMLNLLAKLGAIDPEAWEHKAVWCQNFIDGVASVYQNRQQQLPQKPSFDGQKPSAAVVSTDRNTGDDGVSTDGNTQTIVEETIVEETIVDKTGNGAPRLIFDHWNSKDIIKHKKLTSAIRSAINTRLKDYSLEEIKAAIDTYAEILKGPEYYWSHPWTLLDYLKPRNIEKFMEPIMAKEAFKTHEGGNGRTHRAGQPGNAPSGAFSGIET